MYKDRNTSDKQYRKSAKAVGQLCGTYHPQGTLVYMMPWIRMSQWWKQNITYVVDMQGNNGSMDGDSSSDALYRS